MWEIIASIAVVLLSCYWGGAIMMSPMLFAAHGFGKSRTDLTCLDKCYFPLSKKANIWTLEN
jgi:hypothetical protein